MDILTILTGIVTIASFFIGVPACIALFVNVNKKDISMRGFTGIVFLVAFLFFFGAILSSTYIVGNQLPEETEPTIIAQNTTEATVPTDAVLRPTPLTQCELIEDSNKSGSTSDVCIGNWMDKFGNCYIKSLRFWVVDAPNWSNIEHISYRVEKGYETLSGTIATEEESDWGTQMIVTIYLDGVSAYQSDIITISSEPQQFTIDISSASEIYIACSTNTNCSGYCIVSASLS